MNLNDRLDGEAQTIQILGTVMGVQSSLDRKRRFFPQAKHRLIAMQTTVMIEYET
jgi:hypothetical protein